MEEFYFSMCGYNIFVGLYVYKKERTILLLIFVSRFVSQDIERQDRSLRVQLSEKRFIPRGIPCTDRRGTERARAHVFRHTVGI